MTDEQSAVDSFGSLPLGPPPLEIFPPSYLVPTFVREMDLYFSRTAKNGDGLIESLSSILRFRKAIGLLLREYGHAVEPFLAFMGRVQSSNPSIRTDLEREWINHKAKLQGIEIEYEGRNRNDEQAGPVSKMSRSKVGRPETDSELDKRVIAIKKANPKISRNKIASILNSPENPITKRDIDLSIDRLRHRNSRMS